MIRAREIVYLILGLMIGVAIAAVRADGLRVEAALGQCKYKLAEDSSWHYGLGGFENNMNLKPHCWNLSALWNLDKTFGLRFSYVDLGTMTADNTYPWDEQAYFDAVRNHTAIETTPNRIQGQQKAKGFSLGPVIEAQHRGFTFSAETGLALLKMTWHVMTPGAPGYDRWDFADGTKVTPYIGAAVRYGVFFVGVRDYLNVHASRTDVCSQCYGPTHKAVVQTLVGVSIPL